MKKVQKPVAKTAEVKKAVAPATATPKTTELHKFYVDTAYGVRYGFKDGEPVREVACIHVSADHDLANEPEKARELLGDALVELRDRGYCLSDYEANCEACLQVEESLGEWKFMVEYGKKCQKCTVDFLEAMRKTMKLVREQRELRIRLNRDCDSIPEVIPEDWHVEGKKFVDDTKKPAREVHLKKIELKDAPKEVQQIVKNLLPEIQKTKALPEKVENTVAKKLPAKKTTKK